MNASLDDGWKEGKQTSISILEELCNYSSVFVFLLVLLFVHCILETEKHLHRLRKLG
jgi:hypothetical protein